VDHVKRRSIPALVAAGALAAPAAAPLAQEFPSRPVRLVVPQPPGSASDTIVRRLAARLSQVWGQGVVVDNRPGGGVLIATDHVAKSAPDGHTLLFTYTDHIFYPHYHDRLPYDAIADFAPITTVASQPMVFVVHPSVPVTSIAELIAHAKAAPGRLNFASVASGGSLHLAVELFKWMAGVDLTHVPYRGSAPAITDLVAGRVQMMAPTRITALPLVRDGKVRALAVTTPRRIPELPDLPTVAEAGVPGYSSAVWYGLLAPARTPPALVARLNRDIVDAVRSEEVSTALANGGAAVETRTPEEFAELLRGDLRRWGEVIRAANIRLD
jgi:tripartite-type tricarboxylate transporter receptor subunit TctC